MTSADLDSNEFNPFYGHYIDLAKDMGLIDGLRTSLAETTAFIRAIPEDKLEYRYADGKWSIKEILRHIIDTERVFAYRSMRFARNDVTELPGFDQDAYIPPAMASLQSMSSLIQEYETNRMATVHMFANFSDDMLKCLGRANKSPMSVRAAGFVIIGHERHHCSVIKKHYL